MLFALSRFVAKREKSAIKEAICDSAKSLDGASVSLACFFGGTAYRIETLQEQSLSDLSDQEKQPLFSALD